MRFIGHLGIFWHNPILWERPLPPTDTDYWYTARLKCVPNLDWSKKGCTCMDCGTCGLFLQIHILLPSHWPSFTAWVWICVICADSYRWIPLYWDCHTAVSSNYWWTQMCKVIIWPPDELIWITISSVLFIGECWDMQSMDWKIWEMPEETKWNCN